MNKDEMSGKFDQAKGRIKQGVGDLTDDERLKNEGAADEAGGQMQEGLGKFRDKAGDVLEDVGNKIKR